MSNFIRSLNPSPSRPKFQMENTANFLINFLKDGLQLPTIIAIGAMLQAILLATLPTRVALAPVTLYLLLRLTSIGLQTQKIIPSQYDTGVVPGKVSAQLAPRNASTPDTKPASQPLLVFMLGVRFNHPLGQFCPGGQEIISYFQSMQKDLSAHAAEYGLLGASNWIGTDRTDTNTLMILYYFRDVEQLNAFAHGPVHRKGWDWYSKTKHAHIGIMHEAFQVPAESYESIYVNFPPTMMGATASLVEKDQDGQQQEQEWVNSLVKANKGPLRSQFGRMAKSKGNEQEKYGEQLVWDGE